MRLATLILGLVFSLMLMLQSCMRYNLDVAANQGAGSTAFYGAVVALVAAALVMRYPLVAAIGFMLSALLVILATATYPDVWFVVWVFVPLAVLSLGAWWRSRATA